VALARAIALDPMLVMYDEPFAGLDPISLGVVGQLIRKLNDALGVTSVLVTHDIYESLKIVDYIYFVSAGRIVTRARCIGMRLIRGDLSVGGRSPLDRTACGFTCVIAQSSNGGCRPCPTLTLSSHHSDKWPTRKQSPPLSTSSEKPLIVRCIA